VCPASRLGRTTLTDRLRTHPSVHLVAAVLIAALLAASAAPAGAATGLAAERAHAADVMRRLDLLRTQRDAAALRERSAMASLRATREALSETQAQIAADQRSLGAARSTLAHVLVSSYKGGDQIDSVAYVLAAGSFSDLISRVDLLDHASAANRQLIGQIASAQRRLGAAERARQVRAQQAADAAAAATRERRQLDAAVARTQHVLAGVDASIHTLLRKETARRTHLASSHSGGGSSGGSGSSGGAHSNVFYGDCTWYGPGFAGHRTASGEIFDPNALTAASPWLPFNTELRVTNLATGLSVQVRVNDRGPFGRGVLDLSAHAARIVHLSGWQRVRIEVLPPAARVAHLTL
jgi:rare lipoprotein A